MPSLLNPSLDNCIAAVHVVRTNPQNRPANPPTSRQCPLKEGMMVDQSAIEGFKESLRGPLLQSADPDYGRARKVWTSILDKCPQLLGGPGGVAAAGMGCTVRVGKWVAWWRRKVRFSPPVLTKMRTCSLACGVVVGTLVSSPRLNTVSIQSAPCFPASSLIPFRKPEKSSKFSANSLVPHPTSWLPTWRL